MIGTSLPRRESKEKTSGQVRYLNDLQHPGYLHGAVKRSAHAYAKIKAIRTDKARAVPGVFAVCTGADFPFNFGLYLGDKPPLARDVVRYHGEPVVAVVADTLEHARKAAALVEIDYEFLEPVRSARESYETSVVLHPEMGAYAHIPPIHPQPGTNIANRTRIRKGDYAAARREAHAEIESWVSIPSGDHAAMETRACIAEITGSGEVILQSTTQAPFVVKSLMSAYFGLDAGKIVVKALPLGGGFGGKAGIQLEGLAYLLSREVGGRPVKLVNTREEDLTASPGRIGMQARVKLCAREDGEILGAELLMLFDSGAYADYAVNISRAAAIASSGPYRIPNLHCDALCMYTNHPFATAFRGFGHIEMSFAMEKAMDRLADELGMDPLRIRWINAIRKGDTTPTGSQMSESTGNLRRCLEWVGAQLEEHKGWIEKRDDGAIVVKGIAGLWKAPAMPPNADAGAILTFNADGSCNLHTGVVEIGQGTKTGLCQIAAEALRIPVDHVHAVFDVDTRTAPSDWATAASRSLFMAGRATLDACEDALAQLKATASEVLGFPVKELDHDAGWIFVRDHPDLRLSLAELGLGYVRDNGNALRGQVIGVGRYIAPNLTDIDEETGQGHPDLEWTLGAQGVVIAVRPESGRFRILKAVTALDVGKVINPFLARGQTVGGMAMGIGYATLEGFDFNDREQILNGSFRDYKIPRIDQIPEYAVLFVETPQLDGPYGARGLGEQSIIGMPGAIVNALSRAVSGDLSDLPVTAEKVWREGVRT